MLLITVDEDWQKAPAMPSLPWREAGIKVKRTVLSGSIFWND